MADTKDILIKAAEDVQQGLWCTGSWFAPDIEVDTWWLNHHKVADAIYAEMGAQTQTFTPQQYKDQQYNEDVARHKIWQASLTLEQAERSRKCAEGSIIYASWLLDGSPEDTHEALEHVRSYLVDQKLVTCKREDAILDFNDSVVGREFMDVETGNDANPVEAGMKVAEVFRAAAEVL